MSRRTSYDGGHILPDPPAGYWSRAPAMRIPLHPSHPERICWGCDQLCPADDLRCGNEVVRAMHPVELLGDDWVVLLAQREARTTPPADERFTR